MHQEAVFLLCDSDSPVMLEKKQQRKMLHTDTVLLSAGTAAVEVLERGGSDVQWLW